MKNQPVYLILCMIFIIILPGLSAAQTTMTVTSLLADGMINEEDTAARYEKFIVLLFETNREIIPTAFALINTVGYPNGRSIIKPFPHLEFGSAVGGGVLEYGRLNDYTDDNPTFPFAGINGGFHVGTGIISGLDVTLKVFVLSLGSLYGKTKTFENGGETTSYKIEIEDADLNSYGVKVRYNFVERRVILPLVFSFGGMTVNLAFDYMQGKMKSNFEMTDYQGIDVGGTETGVKLIVNGEPDIDFKIYSVTPEAFMYFDFFTHISFYTGPSVSFNFGEFNFKLRSQGFLYDWENGQIPIATADLTSNYKMEPKLLLPKWTVGLEFSLLALKLQVEGSSLLTSTSDSFTGQVGIRFQF